MLIEGKGGVLRHLRTLNIEYQKAKSSFIKASEFKGIKSEKKKKWKDAQDKYEFYLDEIYADDWWSLPRSPQIILLNWKNHDIKLIKIDDIKYAIINLSEKLIRSLKQIDEHIRSQNNNYSSIVSRYNKNDCILFNENDMVKQVFQETPSSLCLNFKYITKGYYNNPVIHIIR